MTTAVLEVASEVATAPPPATRFKVGELKLAGFVEVKNAFKNEKDAIDILNFIDFLAQNNAANADDLELPFERMRKKQEWNLSRADATKLFFGHLEAAVAAGKANVVLPDEAAKKAISAAILSRQKAALDQKMGLVLTHRNNAVVHFDRHMVELREARKVEEEVDLLQGLDPTAWIDAMIQGLGETNWNFHQFESGRFLKLVSRSDIILRHIDDRAGLRFELNCGKFMFKLDLRDMKPLILPFERCAFGGLDSYGQGNIHPHVRADGHICFGNGADAAMEAQVAGDILKLLKLVDNMLPHYNSESPYIEISRFKRLLDERDRREREQLVQKEKAATAATSGEATQAPALDDQETLDDEPEFTDELEWSDSNDDE